MWISSLPDFCRDALKIKPKMGEIAPMVLNRAQLYIHDRLEAQLRETGKVRAIILKGRQQGCTTYVQARFYWKTSLSYGKKAYILTHRIDASENVFDIADRFHKHAPLKPKLGTSNAKEMVFPLLDSGYQVATAGASGTGRSGTAQLFHGSEVAYWAEAEMHMSGIGQVIPTLDGTEIILESTANGLGNLFHRIWVMAERGESDYIAIFVPWFWQSEYRKPVPDGFSVTEEEQAYASAHGLDLEQMAWRRSKINDDFAGDPHRFAQEYPATAAEAFVAVGHDPLIAPELVLAARGRKLEPNTTGLVVGVDPARMGKDHTAIARRRGRQCLPVERIHKRELMHQVGVIVLIIRNEHPLRVFIDVGGLGVGIYDRLVELGYGDVVTAVNFGSTANEPYKFVNRRAEMWAAMRDWLALGSIPSDDVLASDLVGPKYKYDSEGRLSLEKKEEMAKRGVASPNSGDALAITFAMPISHLASSSVGGRAWEDMISAFEEVERRGMDGIEGVHTG